MQDRLVVGRQPDRLGDALCSGLRTLGALDPPQRGLLGRGGEPVEVAVSLRVVGERPGEVLGYVQLVDVVECLPGAVLLSRCDGAQSGVGHQAPRKK